MIRKLLRRLGQLLLVLIALFTLFVWHTWNYKPLSAGLFYERLFMKFAVDSPELLSSLRILPSWMDWYSDDLSDRSLARETQLNARMKQDLAILHSYDRSKLKDQLSYDVLDTFLSTQVEGQEFRFHNYPLNQLEGEQSGLPTFMATQHPVTSVGEANDYVARLRKFPKAFEQVLEGLQKRESLNITPPRFVLEKVLTEMRGFVSVGAKNNVLYTALKGKLEKAGKNIPTSEADRLLLDTEQVLQNDIFPSYQKLISYYEKLLPSAQSNNGVWALPDGDRFYQWCIKQHTTTTMNAEQIHQIGLAEVQRIEAEMDAILHAENLTEGSIGTRVNQIATRGDQLYPDSDAGRLQILADYQKIIDEMNAGLAPYFNVRATQSVKVERIPSFKEKTSPGAYHEAAAMDGSRPGVFYANLRTVAETPKFSMRTLAYHEAIPGHHFQIDVQQHIQNVPTFRKLVPFTAFAEGWALYAEQLAWEAGFQKQPLDNLGRLQAEMFRAVRLVVDTGMHSKRWTREQSIAYMLEKTGMPEGDVIAEIERYLVWPGQALAYKTGMIKILELRTRAKNKLGTQFDIREFHDQVLTHGSMPLNLLERNIDQWIAKKLGK